MTNNEDKREFEFIEHPVSTNKHNSSCSSSTIIKMWVLLEGTPDPEELKADITHVKNLNDFKDVLISEFDDVLREIKKRNIVLLNNDNTPLRPGTNIQTLVTTDEKPLIVRYPISSANLKVTFTFERKQEKREIPHTSGSFVRLKALAKEIFEDLEDDIYFIADKTEIWDAYNLNTIIRSQTALDVNDVTLRLAVKVNGRKKYTDWKLQDVFNDILREPTYSKVCQIPKFRMKDFPPLDPPFTKVELDDFTKQLDIQLHSFDNEFGNETKNRAYINIFMAHAIYYIRKHVNSEVLLDVESFLKGSCGYGPVDYWVIYIAILLLICEAKSIDMDKGFAQVIVQLRSAIEQLEQLDLQLGNPVIYGITTTGKLWRFIRWSGPAENPEVLITDEYTCDFKANKENEKEILTYITQIIKAQVGLYNKIDERPSKRIKVNT